MIRACLFGCLLLLGLAACDGDGLDDERTALLRIVHAADAETISVRLDNTTIALLDFREVASYQTVEAGSGLLDARVEDNALVPFQEQFFLNRDSSYTLVLTGAGDALTLLLTTDDRRTPSGGQARVRILHGAADTGAVDAEITAEDDVDTVLETFDDLEFGETATSFTLAPGTYTFFIDETTGTGDTALDVTLETGRSYLLVLTDAVSGRTLDFIVAGDD